MAASVRWNSSGADLKIFNTEALDRKATSGDFEYHMYTDVTTPPTFFGYNMVNYVRADIDRFKNADATADNVTGTAVYGGYSSLGNTTTNNKIKITNTNNTNLNVYGGYTADAGDSTNNHVTIMPTGKVKSAYGGYATAANSKAEGNSVTVALRMQEISAVRSMPRSQAASATRRRRISSRLRAARSAATSTAASPQVLAAVRRETSSISVQRTVPIRQTSPRQIFTATTPQTVR